MTLYLIEIVLLLLGIFVLIIAKKCKNRLDYFKNRNIPYKKSFPFIGALSDAVFGRKAIYDCTDDIYSTAGLENEPFFGIFMFHKPSLLIKDPEIIKNILVKDFNSFSSHHASCDDHDPIGSDSLFFAKDPVWRNLRKKITPFFTCGKMKLMFPMVDEISDNFVEHLEKLFSGNNSIKFDVKEKLSLFTTDVIASCAFGINANSLNNPNSEFVTFGRRLFEFTFHRGMEFTSLLILPEITKFFNFKLFTEEGTKFIKQSINHVLNEREKSKVTRNDLIDTFIEIKNSQYDENEEDIVKIESLIAQAGFFVSAGYETSSGTSTFLLYELSKNLDIQDRVRKEIREVMKKNNGKLTYEVIMYETPYLHQVLLETLRIYPVLPFLDRECTNPDGYSLKPFSEFVVPYKMPIYIPIYSIQRDQKYFPDPLKFDPERFSPENIDNVPAFTNLPFGTGNRSCIGERFGLMQSKIGVIKVLMNYRVEMTDETPKDLKLAINAIMIQSKVPIILNLVKDKLDI